MRQGVIAVDIDEVLAQHNAALAKWHNTHFGTAHTAADYFTDRWMEIWQVDNSTVEVRAKGFFKPAVFGAFEPVPGASDALRILKQTHSIIVITVRRESIAAATEQWIEQHFPGIFDEVYFAFNRWEQNRGGLSKGQLCRELGASILVDDSVKHCEDALAHGVTPYLFGNYTWNQISPLPNGVTRVYDWPALIKAIGVGEFSKPFK